MPLWVAPKGARSLRPLPEGRVSTRVVMCDSTAKAITYPQPRCFCYSYCEKILPAALRAKNTAKWDRLDKIPNLNRIPSPGPGHQPTSLLPQISGQVRGRGPGPEGAKDGKHLLVASAPKGTSPGGQQVAESLACGQQTAPWTAAEAPCSHGHRSLAVSRQSGHALLESRPSDVGPGRGALPEATPRVSGTMAPGPDS